MTLLLTLHDTDAGLPAIPFIHQSSRTAARGLLFDANGNIAVMYVANKNYHKLPGGGLEDDETPEEGFLREVAEETGCTLRNPRFIGTVEEYLAQWGIHHTSYAYVAQVNGPIGQPNLTAEEKALGFTLKWMPPEHAMVVLSQELDNPDYKARFITRRDLVILRAAQTLIA